MDPQGYQHRYQHIDAQADTAAVVLGLDSGFDGFLSLVVALVPESETIDHFSVGSLPLGSVPIGSTNAMPDTKGLFGAHLLTERGAIIDFATDTLYLRAGDTTHRSGGPAATSPTKTLRAVLEAAGHYRTFLALMQEAGLTPLLEQKIDRAPPLDSIVWAYRKAAIQHVGLDTLRRRSRDRSNLFQKLMHEAMERSFRRPGQLTAFVPTDDAFAQVAPDTLQSWHADKARLAAVLRTHLLMNARLQAGDLQDFVKAVKSHSGELLDFYPLGASHLEVARTLADDRRVLGRATIVEPDLAAVNGIAHGIDHLLLAAALPSPLTLLLEQEGYTSVTLRGIGGPYAVDATVGGKPVRLLVDTGSPDALYLSPETIEHLGLSRDTVEFALGRGPTVSLPYGKYSRMDGINQSLAQRELPLPPLDGILGAAFLERYGARFDLGGGTLYLLFSKPPSP